MLGTCNTRATARQTVNVHVCTQTNLPHKWGTDKVCWDKRGSVGASFSRKCCRLLVSTSMSRARLSNLRSFGMIETNQEWFMMIGVLLFDREFLGANYGFLRTLILDTCKLFCKIVLSIVRNVYCLFGGYVFFITRTLSRES